MTIERALNIAIGCVMCSALENAVKQDVVNKLRGFEEMIELVEYRKYSDSEIVDQIEKTITQR